MKKMKIDLTRGVKLYETDKTFEVLDVENNIIGLAKVRILEPSEPQDGCPGNTEKIHIWSLSIRNKENEKMFDTIQLENHHENILELETVLGEWPAEKVTFLNHKTLGLVTCLK